MVENAIHHGVENQEASDIEIQLFLRLGLVHFGLVTRSTVHRNQTWTRTRLEHLHVNAWRYFWR